MDLVGLVAVVEGKQSLRGDRDGVGERPSKPRFADIQADTQDDDVAEDQVHRDFEPDSWKAVEETSDEAHVLGYRSNSKVPLLVMACLSTLG